MFHLNGAAQTCCSAGAPITSSFDILNSDTRSFNFRLDYEYKSVNRLVDNNEVLRNDPRNREGSNLLFKTDFILNKHWSFSALLPYVFQRRATISQEENSNGIGDLTLLAQYSRALKANNRLNFTLGIKLPTGQQFNQDDRGIILSPDMQSGSGTTDFIGRAGWLSSHFLIPNLGAQFNVTYRINSTNNHFGDPGNVGGRKFKFGNETQVAVQFNYLLLVNKWFVLPDLGIRFRQAEPNEEQGIDAPNSGGVWWSLPLGISFQPNTSFNYRIYGEFPFFQDLEGLQITTDYQVGIQFNYTFQFSN